MKPFLKWVGGKSRLLNEIIPLFPENYNCYYEPFIGGGSVFLNHAPKNAIINDINSDLIMAYKEIRDNPDNLIELLSSYENTKEKYYELRDISRTHKDGLEGLSDLERAARMIFLNKTCFNGLFRVNKQGHMNAAYGYYENPLIVDRNNLLEISNYLNSIDIMIYNTHYENILGMPKENDFVYLDPPYIPLSSTESYTGYAVDGFPMTEHKNLKQLCDDMNDRGVKWLMSNSSSQITLDLYKDYNISYVKIFRGQSQTKRKFVEEVLIKNY